MPVRASEFAIDAAEHAAWQQNAAQQNNDPGAFATTQRGRVVA